jgi:hypothetical protein
MQIPAGKTPRLRLRLQQSIDAGSRGDAAVSFRPGLRNAKGGAAIVLG